MSAVPRLTRQMDADPRVRRLIEQLSTYSMAIVQITRFEPESEDRRRVLAYLEACERRLTAGMKPDEAKVLIETARSVSEGHVR